MRYYGRQIIALLFVFGILICLWYTHSRLNEMEALEKTVNYRIRNAISYDEASQVLEEAEDGYLGPTFWSEKKNAFVENTEWYRGTNGAILEICGESSVLFPLSFPLGSADETGCLLGDEMAWNLFGSYDVIGSEVVYEGKTYEVRGVLKDSEIMVCQSVKGSATNYSYFSMQVQDENEKNKKANALQNEYGIYVKEVPLYFYGVFIRMQIIAILILVFIPFWLLLYRRVNKNKKSKKRMLKLTIGISIFSIIISIIYVSGITAYSLPNQMSNFSAWSAFFQERKENWDVFRGSEEIFMQQMYRKWLF